MTFARRQTACGMRHCFARRIEECHGRRKLGCTPTRWAERHPQGVCRIRKAAEPPTGCATADNRSSGKSYSNTNRGNAARRHSHSGGISVIQASDCQSKAFLLGVQRGHSLLQNRMAPLKPQEKGFHCKRAARRDAALADCTSLRAALPRWVLRYDLICSYYPLLRSRWRLCRLTDAVHPLRVPLCSSCRSAN